MRTRHVLTAVLLSAAALPALRLHAEEEAPRRATLEDLAWLAGTWRAEEGGDGFEEHWTAPLGGTLAAVSRQLSGGRTTMVELSTICAVGEDLVLHLRHFDAVLRPSALEADGALAWKLAEWGERRAVFSDASRQFPRSVTYERDGDVLRAKLAGTRGDQPLEMAFELRRVE